jgi:hypothetical protein
MRGQVPTPVDLVDKMVARLFEQMPPSRGDRLLEAGCGEGAFISGIMRWCEKTGAECPEIVGIEQDPRVAQLAASRFSENERVVIETADYLAHEDSRRFKYVIGNPPYVSLGHLSEEERGDLRQRYTTAIGRFDLYMLFFEKACGQLAPGGRLSFVTPEKWLYVASAAELRKLLAKYAIEEIEFLPGRSFRAHIAYPAITVLRNAEPEERTVVVTNDSRREIDLREAGKESWLSRINGAWAGAGETTTLSDICQRISVGVATGAEKIFILPEDETPKDLRRFARPALAGRELSVDHAEKGLPRPRNNILIPYDENGELIPEDKLGHLGAYLNQAEHKEKLKGRSCANRKPWYAFHDSFDATSIYSPKILWKDICREPVFWVDEDGLVVPRHSVYYLIPKDPEILRPLADWLNGERARAWLKNNCQRAANGYLRLQSSVVRDLPVPEAFSE